jgi:tetratricopeptide (TPR) repeat protein
VSRWASARIDEIERRREWIPIRHHFGVRALGVNAYVGAEAGDSVIGEHVEDWRGHEELYLVLSGHATFTVAGDEIDAPARTLVYVRDPNAKRGAVAKEAGTTILAAGGKPGEAFVPSGWERGWPYVERADAHVAAGRYAEAAEVMREGLDEIPEHSGFRYNLACYSALAGDHEAAFEALRQAVGEYPRFAELAREEPDFAPIRVDPRFAELVR